MASLAPIVIMTVNYSHDIATALLAASGAAMWMLSRNYPAAATPAAERFFLRMYGGITRIARDSLYWILLAGVPRIIFYQQYEWSDRAGDLQVVAIIIKHIVMFLLVGTGLFFWLRLGKRVRELKQRARF